MRLAVGPPGLSQAWGGRLEEEAAGLEVQFSFCFVQIRLGSRGGQVATAEQGWGAKVARWSQLCLLDDQTVFRFLVLQLSEDFLYFLKK